DRKWLGSTTVITIYDINRSSFYNTRWIHSALEYKPPDETYFNTCNMKLNDDGRTRTFTHIFHLA
ncbi:MAG: hypothetical protein VB126_10525, partial [Paludibacter sp.]|nr:hypothetical protein [Paludibacter sp.]